MSKPKAKTKRKPRRVVLGVGHPRFFGFAGNRGAVLLLRGPYGMHPEELAEGVTLFDRIRLVAEVLK